MMSTVKERQKLIVANSFVDEEDFEDSAFHSLAERVASCLVKSDMKRDESNDGASTGWTSWVDADSASRLEEAMGQLELPTTVSSLLTDKGRDETLRWVKWMKASPNPMILDLSAELRNEINKKVDNQTLQIIDSTREAFLNRLGCRMIVLPSGKELVSPLRTPVGAMAYGRLLFGGVKRYRMLGGGQRKRRAGERTEVFNGETSCWLQYGGPERKYEALDIGPCALVEVTLLPQGVAPVPEDEQAELRISNVPRMLPFLFRQKQAEEKPKQSDALNTWSDSTEWGAGVFSFVGGLQPQVEDIFRRVVDGRQGGFPGVEGNGDWSHELAALGLTPVKGLLLYGPPGCGKTILAKEIARSLRSRPPKIVAAPELLDRWVGGTEKLVRDLFREAENEWNQCGGDPSRSALHVIVVDEIDAVFRKRSSLSDSGSVTRASAVNQILSKLDGVSALGNILFIGMTNRKELVDDALLRPGRLEVHIEVSLPNRDGRREILKIHFEPLRRSGRLTKPLCRAIDGDGAARFASKRPTIADLASDQWTGSFSGADIAGLVRCAGSIALARCRSSGVSVDNLMVTVSDVMEALGEVKR